MKKLYSVTLFLALISLMGCKSIQHLTEERPVPSVTPAVLLYTPSPTVVDSPTRTHTLTSIVATRTPQTPVFQIQTPIPTVILSTTVSLPDVMNYECLEIVEKLPTDQAMSGVLVFNQEYKVVDKPWDLNDTYLWNLETGTQLLLPHREGEQLLGFEVSPNRKKLLYTDSDRNPVIATSAGEIVWTQSLEEWEFYDWFDNDNLLVTHPNEEGLPSLFLQNISSGERRALPMDFPDFYGLYPDISFQWGRLVYFSPTLKTVVYPANRVSGQVGLPIVLWSLETEKEIARIASLDQHGYSPIWKPDGEEFIIVTDTFPELTRKPYFFAKEFYAVEQDGTIRQLTHFMSYFKESNIYPYYSLSANGRFAAFWLAAEIAPVEGYRWLPEDEQLAVLDTETGKVINYCIGGDLYVGVGNEPQQFLPAPIWSPDSTQLLIVDRDPTDETRRRVILVDIVNNYAAVIAENVEPVGWMVAP